MIIRFVRRFSTNCTGHIILPNIILPRSLRQNKNKFSIRLGPFCCLFPCPLSRTIACYCYPYLCEHPFLLSIFVLYQSLKVKAY